MNNNNLLSQTEKVSPRVVNLYTGRVRRVAGRAVGRIGHVPTGFFFRSIRLALWHSLTLCFRLSLSLSPSL